MCVCVCVCVYYYVCASNMLGFQNTKLKIYTNTW